MAALHLSHQVIDKEVRNKLKEDLGLKTVMGVPRLIKVVLNVGLGEAKNNKGLIPMAVKALEAIGGQKSVAVLAKKSVAGFKLREGMVIGAKVTLRKQRMYDFLTRLIHVYIPRIRDFHGLKDKSFDGRGNFSLGINDMRVFPEVDNETAANVPGLSISIITDAGNNQKAVALFKSLGMPYA